MAARSKMNPGATMKPVRVESVNSGSLAEQLLELLDENIMESEISAYRKLIIRRTKSKMTKNKAQILLQKLGAYSKDGKLNPNYR